MNGNSGDGSHTHGNPLEQAPQGSVAPLNEIKPDEAIPDWPDAHGSPEFALAAELATAVRLAQAQRADGQAMIEVAQAFYGATLSDPAPSDDTLETALATFYADYHDTAPKIMRALANTPQIVDGQSFPLPALLSVAGKLGPDPAPVFGSLLDRGYLEFDESGKVRRGAEFPRLLELVAQA